MTIDPLKVPFRSAEVSRRHRIIQTGLFALSVVL